MLISTGTAASLMASGLVRLTDISSTSWKHDARLSFSYRQSSVELEVRSQISGSSGMVTLYNQTNIISFTITTILSASAAVDSHKINPPLNLITTTISSNTIVHTTTFISNPRTFIASKVVSKEEDNKIYPQGNDHSASQLDPSITTAITLNDVTVNICQNLVISVIIKLTSLSLFTIAYPENTSSQVVSI